MTEPSVKPSNTVAADERPEQAKQRKRNLLFDALAEATHADPTTEGGRIVAGLKLIRQAFAADRPEGSEAELVELIHERAALYRRRWPEMELTPTALAGNWRRVTLPLPGATARPKPPELEPEPEPEVTAEQREENLRRARELRQALGRPPDADEEEAA